MLCLYTNERGRTKRKIMKCPVCNFPDSKVIDSRPTQDGGSIRRRRECLACQKRFTTFEILETVQIFVIKKNGSKEMFDKNKLLSGVLKACRKRPVNAEEIVSDIETELQNTLTQEIGSRQLGDMVMRRLKDIDKVAYIRFASVYREFNDLESFVAELKGLQGESDK